MTNNRDLLKEAIADAKSVKETAIANAKLALEEAFTPYLQDQLSAKLQEMDDEDDKDVKEEKKEEVKEMEAKKEKVDEINLDELLAELELNEDEASDEEEKGYVDGMENEKEDEGEVEDEDVDVEVEDEDVDVEIELDEAMSDPDMRHGMKGDNAEERETEKMRFKEGEELDEMGDATVAAAAGGLENIIDSLKKLSKAAGPAAKKAYAALQALGAGAGAAMRNEEEDYAEMEELKKELQEVNLLNAKLLYTNKIFKAKNLTESKKVKVLKAFDKATDVKQAKAIYETLNEGIVNTITNSRVNESLKRGAASKASGLEPKATKQPILESNEVYDRMRKLAGLI